VFSGVSPSGRLNFLSPLFCEWSSSNLPVLTPGDSAHFPFVFFRVHESAKLLRISLSRLPFSRSDLINCWLFDFSQNGNRLPAAPFLRVLFSTLVVVREFSFGIFHARGVTRFATLSPGTLNSFENLKKRWPPKRAQTPTWLGETINRFYVFYISIPLILD